jgi:hypothetical protein
MSRVCAICHHPQRVEIDQLLATGTPARVIASSYGMSVPSVHRHRTAHAKIAHPGAVKALASQSTAALASLPSKDELGNAYLQLRQQIDDVVQEARAKGSLAIALAGLNSARGTLDSMARLSGVDRPGNTTVNVNVDIDVTLNTAVQQILAAIPATVTEPPIELLQLAGTSADEPS